VSKVRETGMKLDIPDVPPSLNRTLRMHWAKKQDIKNSWILLIRQQLNGAYLKPIVKMRCKITLCHARAYDKDNLYGSVKPLVDALRFNRLIMDDTAKYLDLTVEQSQCAHKERHTVIELDPA
jgi:hypothetical protein